MLSFASCLKSSAPSVAITSWWTRVFSSAYGSLARIGSASLDLREVQVDGRRGS